MTISMVLDVILTAGVLLLIGACLGIFVEAKIKKDYKDEEL